MARIKMKTLMELNKKDLEDRLQQVRNDLSKLKMELAKGTLRKESGKMKPMKQDIARILTRLNEIRKQ